MTKNSGTDKANAAADSAVLRDRDVDMAVQACWLQLVVVYATRSNWCVHVQARAVFCVVRFSVFCVVFVSSVPRFCALYRTSIVRR